MQNLLFLLLQALHVKGADVSPIPSPHHLCGRLVPRCFPLIFIDCLDLVAGSWVSFVGFLENLSCASGIWSASLSRLSFTSSRLSFTSGTIFSKSTASTRVGASTCLRDSWNFSVPFARAVTSWLIHVDFDVQKSTASQPENKLTIVLASAILISAL